jgi:hypothetical protein
LFRIIDIRWVGNNEVEARGVDIGEQVSVMKVDPVLELMTRRVSAGDFKSSGRNICGVDFGCGDFFRQRQRNAEEPDAVTPPVRFDKRGCGNEAWRSY